MAKLRMRRPVGFYLEARATRNARPPLKQGRLMPNSQKRLHLRRTTSRQRGSTANQQRRKRATLRTQLPAGSERTLTGSGTSRPPSQTRTCSCRSRTMLPQQNPSLASSPSTAERKLRNQQTEPGIQSLETCGHGSPIARMT